MCRHLLTQNGRVKCQHVWLDYCSKPDCCYGDHHQLSFPRASLPAEGLCDNGSSLAGFDGSRAEVLPLLDHVSRYLRYAPNREPNRGALACRILRIVQEINATARGPISHRLIKYDQPRRGTIEFIGALYAGWRTSATYRVEYWTRTEIEMSNL